MADRNESPSGFPTNDLFLSPDGSRTPPPRVMSSQDLAGEDIVQSSQRFSEHQLSSVELSPFTPSESETTPPSIGMPTDSLTPPPLTHGNNNSNSSPPMQPNLPLTQSAAEASSHNNNNSNNNKQSAHARPPRIPHMATHPTNRKTHPETPTGDTHGGGHSHTDYSFLSALTDSSSDLSIPKRRTVSWDMNDPTLKTTSPGARTSYSNKSTPASILQPILQDDAVRVVPPRSIVTSRAEENNKNMSVLEKHKDPSYKWGAPGTGSFVKSASERGGDLLDAGRGVEEKMRMPVLETKKDSQSKNITKESDYSTATFHTGNVSSSYKWGAVETGSFVNLDSDRVDSDTGFLTPPRNIDPPQPNRYSFQEVMNANPAEPLEEVLVMKKVESQGMERMEPLLSSITDDRVHDFDGNVGGDEDQQPEQDPNQSKNSATKKGSLKREDYLSHDLLFLTREFAKATSAMDVEKTSDAPDSKKRHRRMQTRNAGDEMYEAAVKLFSESLNEENKNDVETGSAIRVDDTPADKQKFTRCPRLGKRSRFVRTIREDFGYFADFLGPHNRGIRTEVMRLFRFLMLPAIGIAAFLFYVMGNPPTGYSSDEVKSKALLNGEASTSWWILFICVRQVITLEIAKVLELVLLDFATFRTRTFPRLIGPTLSLILAQSKGWPCQLFWWSVVDIFMLAGDSKFPNHWLFWQNLIGLVNAENPSGTVTSHNVYLRLLFCALGLGVVVSFKRAIVGNIVGKRIVRNYRDDLSLVMKKLIILSEVAFLSKRIQNERRSSAEIVSQKLRVEEAVGNVGVNDSFEYSDGMSSPTTSPTTPKVTSSISLTISELLEEWEEPELRSEDQEEITMASVLHFRKALTVISDEFPFSPAFGPVRSREECVELSQAAFERLTANSPSEILHFDTLVRVATTKNGEVDKRKVKELIGVFRPNRSGQLTKLEFIKSIDSVYKCLKLLLCSINNSSQIDRAYESIINIGFYTLVGLGIFAILGIDVGALIVGISSIIVSFAFMIGAASSKYLEGILFILVRRPFDIGDRVSIAAVMDPIDNLGAKSGWIIENVNLYSTTARLGTTREVATFANGALADKRVINYRRSEQANVYFVLKFSVESTPKQLELFRKQITSFIKERPREWIRLVGFRVKTIEGDLGFVEYTIIVQHREAWQNLPAILESKSVVYRFAMEVQQELGMQYRPPPMSIDLRRSNGRSMDFSESIGKSFETGTKSSGTEEPKKDR